jgi:ATP synthase F0 subunit b
LAVVSAMALALVMAPVALAEPGGAGGAPSHATPAEAATHGDRAHGAEAPAHGEAAGHGEGHGTEHVVVPLDNWFSLSFGPGKAHQNGPLAFSILNFVILVWLLVKFGRQPFREYLRQRHNTIRLNLEEAAELNQRARQKLAEIEGRLQGLGGEITAIKGAVAKDARLERDRIIKAAEDEAARIVKQADDALQKEVRRARRRLELEAVDVSMKAAERIIKQQVTDADRRRLNEEYFAQISEGGGRN